MLLPLKSPFHLHFPVLFTKIMRKRSLLIIIIHLPKSGSVFLVIETINQQKSNALKLAGCMVTTSLRQCLPHVLFCKLKTIRLQINHGKGKSNKTYCFSINFSPTMASTLQNKVF